MASLIGKLTAFANSPQGRRMIDGAVVKGKEIANSPKGKQIVNDAVVKGREFAAKPENKQKIDQLRQKLTGKPEPGSS